MTEQLWTRLPTTPALDVSKEWYPDVRFIDLAVGGGVRRFLDVLGWVTEKLRRYN